VNQFQSAVVMALGWVFVLFDGWELHSHWLAALGFALLIYSMWSLWMKTPEDEEFERIEREQEQRNADGWRKRQIVSLRTNVESFDDWQHSHNPKEYWVERHAYLAGFEAGSRNERLKRECND
jgi:hypothetical protein